MIATALRERERAQAAAAAAAVEVRGIGKVYEGGVEALRDVDLAFPRGQLTTLLGPSGCGKTTLLKIIAGLIPATRGQVLVNGRPVSGPGPERAFVFQDFALLPWATALRNAAFGLELRGVARPEREETARRYLRQVGLAGAEDRYPHELSGGMRQRVGLARALAVNADVLLMDEPFSAVDEQTRRKFQEDLLRLVEAERKTFIFVTHSIEEAVYVSDQRHPPPERARPGLAGDRDPARHRGRPRRDPPQPPLSRHGRRDLAPAQAVRGVGGTMRVAGRDIPNLAALLVWAVVWEIVGRLGLVALIPPLTHVLGSMVEVVGTTKFAGAALDTLTAFSAGMAIAIGAGVPIGILMGRFKIADELLGLWVNIFLSAPLTALVPVLMILFGFGQTTIIVTVVLFAIWIIVLDTRAGVRHVSPSLIEMARSFGAGPVQLYGKILILAALPEILTGIRLGVIRGVKGVIIGQLLVSIVGLGELFELYSRSFLIEEFWALTLILFAFAILLAEAVAAVERRVELFRQRPWLRRDFRWQTSPRVRPGS